MKKMINKATIEGLVYENGVELKTVANQESANFGMEYYRGKLHILTGKDNVVAVDIWENARTSKGAPNQKFATLQTLLGNLKTVIEHGDADATAVRINSQISLNEWFREDGQLVSTPQNSGGFINVIDRSRLDAKGTFELDAMVVTSFRGAHPQTGEDNDYLTVQACAFDYRGAILPMTFSVFNPNGINYFESMEPNTFTKIWGRQVSSVIKTQKITENAFGEPLVEVVEKTTKHFELTGCNTIAYDETQLTSQEWSTALQNRETHKADLKTKSEARKAKSTINTAPAQGAQAGNAFAGFGVANGTSAANGGFDF